MIGTSCKPWQNTTGAERDASKASKAAHYALGALLREVKDKMTDAQYMKEHLLRCERLLEDQADQLTALKAENEALRGQLVKYIRIENADSWVPPSKRGWLRRLFSGD